MDVNTYSLAELLLNPLYDVLGGADGGGDDSDGAPADA